MSGRQSKRLSRENTDGGGLRGKSQRGSSGGGGGASTEGDDSSTGGKATTSRSRGSSGRGGRNSAASATGSNRNTASNGRRGKRSRASSADEESEGGGGGRERQRRSLISYKEQVLAKLLEAKSSKEAELGRRDPSSLKRTAPLDSRHAAIRAPHLHDQYRGRGIPPGSPQNGEAGASDDDTPPLILTDAEEPQPPPKAAIAPTARGGSILAKGQPPPPTTAMAGRGAAQPPATVAAGGRGGPPVSGGLQTAAGGGGQIPGGGMPPMHGGGLPMIPPVLQGLRPEQIQALMQTGQIQINPAGQYTVHPQLAQWLASGGLAYLQANMGGAGLNPYAMRGQVQPGGGQQQPMQGVTATAPPAAPPSSTAAPPRMASPTKGVAGAPAGPPPPPQPPQMMTQQGLAGMAQLQARMYAAQQQQAAAFNAGAVASPYPPSAAAAGAQALQQQQLQQQQQQQQQEKRRIEQAAQQHQQAATTAAAAPAGGGAGARMAGSPSKAEGPASTAAARPPSTVTAPPAKPPSIITTTAPPPPPSATKEVAAPPAAAAAAAAAKLPATEAPPPPIPTIPPTTATAPPPPTPAEGPAAAPAPAPVAAEPPPPPQVPSAPVPKATIEVAPARPIRPPLATVLGGMQQRPGVLSKVEMMVVKMTDTPSDAEVAPLIARREEVLSKLRDKSFSGVVNKPALLPAPRRKAHWDYLLEEMRWMATDFHEERKWKRAAAEIISLSAASELGRRGARERREGEDVRRVCQRLTNGVMSFWRVVSGQIRYYNESRASLSSSSSSAAAAGGAQAIDISKAGYANDLASTASEDSAPLRESTSSSVAANNKVMVLEETEATRLTEEVNECAQVAQEVLRASSEASTTHASTSSEGGGGVLPLLPHQVVALHWIQGLGEKRYGAILADGTGLGKTVTAVRVMVELAAKAGGEAAAVEGEGGNGPTPMEVAGTASPSSSSLSSSRPQLLIVPYWSVLRWRNELEIHGHGLSVVLLEDWGPAIRSKSHKKVDIVLCSSAALGSGEATRLMEHEWSNLVLDIREQRDKPPSSLSAATESSSDDDAAASKSVSEWGKTCVQALKIASNADRRLMLVEEGVGSKGPEEQSACFLAILLPKVFKSSNMVKAWASKAAVAPAAVADGPDNSTEPPAVQEYIQRFIGSFTLQRSRSECERFVPVPEVHVVKCPMPALQEIEYKRVQSPVGDKGAPPDAEEISTRILAARFVCIHPDLTFWYRPTAEGNEGGSAGGSGQFTSRYVSPGSLPSALPFKGDGGAGVTSMETDTPAASVAADASSPSVRKTAWDDVSVFSHHNSVSYGTEKSGKLAMLLQLLKQMGGQGKKVLLLASLPHALGLIHTFLCAAEVVHDCGFPSQEGDGEASSSSSSSSSSIGSWLSAQLAIARFNISSPSSPITSSKILLVPPSACLGRGGLLPSAADVVVILDDYWGREGRSGGVGVKDVLTKIRMRSKLLMVHRLVLQGTVEETMWPSNTSVSAGPASVASDNVPAIDLAGGITLGQAVSPLAEGGIEDQVEALLSEKERRLFGGSSLSFKAVAGGEEELCRECFNGKSLGAYGKRFLHKVATLAEAGSKGGGQYHHRGAPSPRGDALLMDSRNFVDTGGGEGEGGAIYEASRALVKQVPSGATNAQALLEHSTAMRALGIEMDLSVAAPPVPPPEGLTELITFPSWVEDPATLDFGLVIKYVSVIETIAAQQRRKRLDQRRLPGQRPDGSTESVAESGRPPRVQGRPKVDMPTDWTTEEDQELIWAHETYARNPLIIPFVLNKKAPPYVRKRSSKQCLDRIDALFNQGIHQNDPRIPRPAYVIPPFKGRVLPIKEAVLDIPWTPLSALKKLPRGADAGSSPVHLPNPDHDSSLRLSRSFIEMAKVQGRLRQKVTLPDGPTAPSATTPENISVNPPIPALNILEQMRKSGGGGLGARQGGLMPLSPSPQPGAAPPPPPSSALVNVSLLNPSLTPPATAGPIGGGGGIGGGGAGRGMKTIKRPTGVIGGGGGAGGGLQQAGGAGGGGLPQQQQLPPGAAGMGAPGQKMKSARRSIGGIPGQKSMEGNPGLAGGGSAMSGGGSGSLMKAPTVTLPVNMLAAHQGGGGGLKAGGGGGLVQGGMSACGGGVMQSGAVGMKKTAGRPPSSGTTPIANSGNAVGLPPNAVGGDGGGGQPPANQLYMNQLMALIQKRPDMKSQITQILGRTDLNDSQRIEYIGEILKAANIATNNWGQGGPGGGGGVP